jgi:hypothetical protein
MALMLSATGASAQVADAPPVRDVLARVADYVRQFEANFALAVSDERYEQIVFVDTSTIATRVMDSEMLFVWLPHEQLWLAARNPRVVDGKPVADSAGQLERAVGATEVERRARLARLRDESAKYNIGPIRRNFSDPTFPLQFAAARLQSRFRWQVMERDRTNGVDAWRLDYEEIARPALIRRERISLPASGSIWVDVATGAVVRTRLYVSDNGTSVRANMDVDYRFEPKLDVWVPARMSEIYSQTRERGGTAPVRENRVRCQATYTNYRRFDATVRVLP